VQRGAEESFDLILMDGRMPVMDGLAAARAIRAGGIGETRVLDPGIRMIASTANATGNDRELWLAAGRDDFLSKPVDERLLAQALHRAVDALRARGRPPARPRARAAASPAIVRSWMRSRSNSASVAKMPNTSLPVAVVVSTSPVSTLSPTPRFCRSLTRPTTWVSERPMRSSFQTTRASASRATSSALAKPGRSVARPEQTSS